MRTLDSRTLRVRLPPRRLSVKVSGEGMPLSRPEAGRQRGDLVLNLFADWAVAADQARQWGRTALWVGGALLFFTNTSLFFTLVFAYSFFANANAGRAN